MKTFMTLSLCLNYLHNVNQQHISHYIENLLCKTKCCIQLDWSQSCYNMTQIVQGKYHLGEK